MVSFPMTLIIRKPAAFYTNSVLVIIKSERFLKRKTFYYSYANIYDDYSLFFLFKYHLYYLLHIIQ